MRKNNKKTATIPDIIGEFKLPNNQFFLKNAFLQYNSHKDIPDKIKNSERQIKKYSHIFEENSRMDKALSNLKYFALFIYFPDAPFSLETAYEGLSLIFLLDEVADGNKYPLSYRKKFLEEFFNFIKNISTDIEIITKDKRQKEMQKVWLNHFRRIYCRTGLKQNKWIKATMNFIQGMINELSNKKYKTLDAYLKNAIPSSGALFYWQSIITDAGYTKQNNAQYDKLTKQLGKFLRLINDYTQIREDKNKITALNFCRDKNELKNMFTEELIKFQKMLKESPVGKQIRLAMWRSTVFLYYFYQKNNFWGEV